MIKLCGYFPGYCLSPGECDLEVEGWPDPALWHELFHAAQYCKWRASKTHAGLMTAYKMRRRRDWKVGNPYG